MSGVGNILKSGSGSGSRAWLLYLTLGIVATGVYFLLSGSAQDTLYDLIGVSSVAAVLVGLWWYRPSYRLPWYVLAAAQSTFVAGDITYNIYENVLGIPEPYPSLADAFYFVTHLTQEAGCRVGAL